MDSSCKTGTLAFGVAVHTHIIHVYGAHACRNGNQYMDQYQNIATLYILNQECIMLIIEKSKCRDV